MKHLETINYTNCLVYIVCSILCYVVPALSKIVSCSLIISCALCVALVMKNGVRSLSGYNITYLIFLIYVLIVGCIPHALDVHFEHTIKSLYTVIVTFTVGCVFSYAIKTKRNIFQLFNLYSICAAILTLYVAARFDVASSQRAGTDELGNANILAVICMVAAIASHYCIYSSSSFYVKLLHWSVYCILLVGLVLTGTKKTLVVAILFPLLLSLISLKGVKRMAFLIIAVFIVLLGTSLIMTNELLYQLIGHRFESMYTGLSGQGGIDGSTLERKNMIFDAFSIWIDFPLFGCGANMFAVLAKYGVYSHNNYVEILSTLGLVGFFIYYANHAISIIAYAKLGHNNFRDTNFAFLVILFILFFDIGAVTYNLIPIHLLLASASYMLKMPNIIARIH